jgi:hypothetical protein
MARMMNRRCMMLANSRVLKRSLVAVAIALLMVGLVSILAIIGSPAGTESTTAAAEPEGSPADVAARRADFDFVDHELRYAGGYGLRLSTVGARGEAFDFADHELRYGGGYGLRLSTVGARGAAFDFADHELRYAGGYGLVAVDSDGLE